jgi:putative lipoprotein
MKAMPTYIKIWLIDKETGNRWGIRLHPFKTEEREQNDYKIIYDDIRLNRLYRTFQQAFPERTRAHNISTPPINQFATLKLKLDDHFELIEAYLENNGQKFVLPDAEIHQRYEISKIAYY